MLINKIDQYCFDSISGYYVAADHSVQLLMASPWWWFPAAAGGCSLLPLVELELGGERREEKDRREDG